VRDKGFNYTHFDRAFSIEKEMWHPDQADHPPQYFRGFDIRKLIIAHLSFVDSKSELFIQAVDVLTGFMRRSVRSPTIDRETLIALGRLMIRRKWNGAIQTVRLITLGQEQNVPRFLGNRIRLIASTGRTMLKPERKLVRTARKTK
jgi:hypothetical protein